MSTVVASPMSLTNNNELLGRVSTSSTRTSQAPSAFPVDGAPQQSPSPPSSRTSSLRRRTANDSAKGKERAHDDSMDAVNPIHALAHTGEVHIVKVTRDTVAVASSAPSENIISRIGRTIPAVRAHEPPMSPPTTVVGMAGPPPPSPPASVHTFEDTLEKEKEYGHLAERSAEKPEAAGRMVPEDDVPPTPPPKSILSTTRPVTFDIPVERTSSVDSRESAGNVRSARYLPRHAASSAPGASLLHRAATETEASISTVSSGGGPATIHTTTGSFDTRTPPTEDSQVGSSSGVQGRTSAHLSTDGYLQPPPLSTHRASPRRRNTTGSPHSKPLRLAQGGSHAVSTSGMGLGYVEDPDSDGELANDIERQAEQIRLERQTKREKAQKEAEAALTRSMSKDETKVLVGNLIGEDHVNYVLMYNMLTGIRIAVSRCQAKIKRPLTADDFTACHKYSFDIIGNELTPSAKYDFKFKDYAPWVFRELREDYFQLDPSDYLVSLTAKYILSELGSPGKSGSFFYFSRDYRFIIKTIHHSEHKFLRSILKEYYHHVKENPHTLISRFYGLHRVKLPRGKKIHFVIMNNLFPPHKDIHETYDLKGSTVGREYPEELAKEKPRAVLKDLNWINRGRWLELGPEKRALLEEQLRRDKELLKRVNVMDYSLLVGIHNMRRGNKDNVRRNTLRVFSPDVPHLKRKATQVKGAYSEEAMAMRRAMRCSDLKHLDGEIPLPDSDRNEREHFVFYQDEGGYRATDESNEPMDTIYYLGVIDILTPWNTKKKLEGLWKGLKDDRHKISPVPPDEYAERFFSFMKAIMRGGEGGERFKPKSEQAETKEKIE